jgi:hypothetical protein
MLHPPQAPASNLRPPLPNQPLPQALPSTATDSIVAEQGGADAKAGIRRLPQRQLRPNWPPQGPQAHHACLLLWPVRLAEAAELLLS